MVIDMISQGFLDEIFHHDLSALTPLEIIPKWPAHNFLATKTIIPRWG